MYIRIYYDSESKRIIYVAVGNPNEIDTISAMTRIEASPVMTVPKGCSSMGQSPQFYYCDSDWSMLEQLLKQAGFKVISRTNGSIADLAIFENPYYFNGSTPINNLKSAISQYKGFNGYIF